MQTSLRSGRSDVSTKLGSIHADGKQWLAQGYGKTWPTGEAFDDVQQAIAYVRGIAAAQ